MNLDNIIFCIFVLSISHFACDENSESITDEQLGLNYAPIAIGKYWEYQVDSIQYDTFKRIIIDTVSFLMREEIVDSFRNSAGELIFRADVSSRASESESWRLINTTFFTKNRERMVKTENGLNFIKLVFPVQRFYSWDGNTMINPQTAITVKGEELKPFEAWSYYYKEVQTSETWLNKLYEDVITVEEVNEDLAFNKRYSVAKYARNVGLIYKEQWILNTQSQDISKKWEEKAQSGFILKLILIRNG